MRDFERMKHTRAADWRRRRCLHKSSRSRRRAIHALRRWRRLTASRYLQAALRRLDCLGRAKSQRFLPVVASFRAVALRA